MSTGLVWTKHLEQRLGQRGITRNEAWETIRHPNNSIKLGSNKWKHFRSFGGKQVVIIAVYENSQWIILTAWTKQKGGHVSEEGWLSRVSRRLLFGFFGWLYKNIAGPRKKVT